MLLLRGIWAIVRSLDVRLTLFALALLLGTAAGEPQAIIRTFFATFTSERFVIPIGCAMGFAHVLRQTGCDQHLVHLLVKPFQRARPLLIPGTVVVGFLVNMPVISQTSTLVAIGSVMIPLLRAAGVSAVTTAAALVLGCSIGGELLNPAAPEFRTIVEYTGVDATECPQRVLPLLVPHLLIATFVFWYLRGRGERPAAPAEAEAAPEFRVNLLQALVPLLPVTLLFLSGQPLNWIEVPREWLVSSKEAPDLFHSRLIGAAMLVGVAAAALTSGRAALGAAEAFCEGAGYAFTHIISLIVAASCFGEGIRLIGLAGALGDLIQRWPGLLIPTAALLPGAFAWISGSGMAATQSLFQFFVAPANALGVDAVDVGAIVSVGAAAGRTMSPVAAVTLMAATMTKTQPMEIICRTALPLLTGLLAVIIVGWWLSG
jgi:DcuC family C4-dicarboxylate transporter